MAAQWLGGSFAPRLPPERLKECLAHAESAPPGVAKAMRALAAAVGAHHGLARPKKAGRPHPVGVGTVVPLEGHAKAALDEHLPEGDELDAYAARFEAIPAEDKDLRDAAFHLLWYCRELRLGREPLFAEDLKLPKEP
jgi:hypothetical protein